MSENGMEFWIVMEGVLCFHKYYRATECLIWAETVNDRKYEHRNISEYISVSFNYVIDH